MRNFVVALVVLAACSDQSPATPNLIIENEAAGGTAQIILTNAAGDTVHNAPAAVGTRACTMLNAQSVQGVAIVTLDTLPGAPDTLTIAPFWAAENNNWADVLILRAGPTLVQTHNSRAAC